MKPPRIGTGNVGFPKDILCEVQFTPPIKASARSQRIGSKNAFNARNARNARSLDDFVMFGMASVFEARGENATGLHTSQREKSKKAGGIKGGGMKSKEKGKPKEAEGVDLVVVEKPKAKVGRPQKVVPVEQLKKALEACKLGIPLERVAILAGFPSGNAGGWADYLRRNPSFANELELARLEGELELSSVVRQCGNGWQGSAWLLERTRGYVARASLEHTGKGGKELSISGSLLGAFGGGSK
jgi:hypothetical protein